ncbi:hypothetical protein [Kitasatospora sp. GAS1066B]|uniref:hypothetical protein n=1 Tax=Kitasatospora sp. GAS1066B TaxID=3156271 RepID=UPI00351452E6
MLIENSRYTDARQLTASLVSDPSLRSGDELTAHLQDVVLDAERTAGLLAAWAEIGAMATKDAAAMFVGVDLEADWVRLGLVLADAACRGDQSEVEAAAGRCAEELDPVGRAQLVGSWGRELIPDVIEWAGGLDELLEQVALHRSCAGGEDAAWVNAAAWVVCRLTETGTVDAYNRIGDLIVKDGRGADLWRTWPEVAASMMSTTYLREIEPLPQKDMPGYPVGLPLRAVEAVHSASRKLVKQSQAEFAAAGREDQLLLAFELATLIATCRQLPSRRAARRAARGERDADHEAFSDAARAVMDEMPSAIVERTGRMHALSRRAVLAFIDADRETLAAVVDRIATWDDDPGRATYPRPRFEFPANQALALANDLFRLGEQQGIRISDAQAATGAAELINRDAPTEHREAALALLSAMKGDSRNGAVFDPVAATTEAGLLAFAATAAWLGTNPRLIRSRETVRLNLIKEIRESESRALKVPERETIRDVSDKDALAFLHQLYGEHYPLPRDPAERGAWEMDIVAIVRQHLLETPADATTPEQKKALHERVIAILSAAAGTPRRTPPPATRSGAVRQQPKRKQPKGKR